VQLRRSLDFGGGGAWPDSHSRALCIYTVSKLSQASDLFAVMSRLMHFCCVCRIMSFGYGLGVVWFSHLVLLPPCQGQKASVLRSSPPASSRRTSALFQQNVYLFTRSTVCCVILACSVGATSLRQGRDVDSEV
jgi:hypothetical protein